MKFLVTSILNLALSLAFPWRKALVAGIAAGVLTFINTGFGLNIPISTSGDVAQTLTIALDYLLPVIVGGLVWAVPNKPKPVR